jgi:hypothetical protein
VEKDGDEMSGSPHKVVAYDGIEPVKLKINALHDDIRNINKNDYKQAKTPKGTIDLSDAMSGPTADGNQLYIKSPTGELKNNLNSNRSNQGQTPSLPSINSSN